MKRLLLSLFMILALTSISQATWPAGLVAYWPLDNSDSNKTFSEEIAGRDGICEVNTNSGVSVAGRWRNAFRFDSGVFPYDSYSIHVSNAQGITSDANELSVSFWTKRTGEDYGGASIGNSSAPYSIWSVDTFTGDGSITFSIDNYFVAVTDGNAVPNDGVWHLVVCASKKADSPHQGQIYVDGVNKATSWPNSGVNIPILEVSGIDIASGNHYAIECIDEITVWNIKVGPSYSCVDDPNSCQYPPFSTPDCNVIDCNMCFGGIHVPCNVPTDDCNSYCPGPTGYQTTNITLISTDGGNVTSPGEGFLRFCLFDPVFKENSGVVCLIAAPDANYHFVNWEWIIDRGNQVGDYNSASTWVTMTASAADCGTLRANFAADEPATCYRVLTTSSDANGNVTTPGEGAYNYDCNTNASIIATANTGSHFSTTKGWTGTARDANKITDPNAYSTTVYMDANYTVIANCDINQVSLTTSTTTGGTITTPGAGVYWYGYNAVAPIVAPASTGYHFVDWTTTSYVVSGTLSPDATGYYFNMGFDSYGNRYYQRTDGAYFLQLYYPTNKWTISTTLGGLGAGYWELLDGFAPPGAYAVFPTYTGVATVAAATVPTIADVNSASTTIIMDANYAVTANFAADEPNTTSSSSIINKRNLITKRLDRRQ